MSIVISHIAFFVTDLQRSTHFYREVLQLPPLEEPFKLGLHSWFSLGSGCQLHLIAAAAQAPSMHINHHLALRAPTTFDAMTETLNNNGIVYYDPSKKAHTIHVRPDGIRQVFFQDPDGYWIELNDEPHP
jgi:catechol 2,3-dioxygenase-like lactoylglutathione lyase family enzyme